jgi:predicted enzyme related to lactoylglutathione lyase
MADKKMVENTIPILSVTDRGRSVAFYEKALGFRKTWGSNFACVQRDGWSIYLAEGDQGQPGSWVWVGVEDLDGIYDQATDAGAKIVMEPTNFSWAREVRVADPDGNVLRLGGEPRADEPFVDE